MPKISKEENKMKKILSLVLALSFILCASALFTVSAAETKLNDANKGWKATRGGGNFFTDANREFYWKANASGQTYDWPAVHTGSLEEGTITAKVSASGNIGIFFGGSGVAENVKDGGSNLVGAANTKFSWIVLEVDPSTKVSKLRFYYDDDDAANVSLGNNSQSNMPLNDTPENAAKYGIDGTSDVELKVEFTKAGKMIAYVNGVKTIIRNDGFPTFGNEYGMIVRGNSNYGAASANTEVGYVKSFSTQGDISAFSKWTVRRGGSSWAAVDGGEFLWKYVADGTNGRTYNNLVQYYKDLEEGSASAKVAKNSRIGIAFAGTGFANVKEGSGGALSEAQDCKYYWAVVDWDNTASKYYLALKVDSSATDGTLTTVERVDISDIATISNNDYTIKVDFTKDGDIKVSLNGEELISVTGQTLYGKQLGMITTKRGPLADKAGQTAGTVKAFTIGVPAADTGDLTSVYLVASALILAATFAVVCVSRKKIAE